MTQHQIDLARVRRRYTSLSLPLRESMLDALQRHKDAAQADKLTPKPRQDATDNECRGAWNE